MENFEKKKIVVNSQTFYPTYPAEFINKVKDIIFETKLEWNKINWYPDPDIALYKGTRYSDNEKVLSAVLGSIRSTYFKHTADLTWDEAVDESNKLALLWAEVATDEDIKNAVESALRYSARADYWYMFEKNYEL